MRVGDARLTFGLLCLGASLAACGDHSNNADVQDVATSDAARDGATDVAMDTTDDLTVDDMSAPDDDVPTPVDVTGLPPGDVLPAFDADTVQHIQALLTSGAARGNHANVVAKIGDSITESQSFLWDCGAGYDNLGSYANLQATLDYFTAFMFPDGTNPLTRASQSAVSGWTSGDALMGGDSSALEMELSQTQAQWAIVMYGTNDIDRSDFPTYLSNMGMILDRIEAHSAIAILSTIPDRLDDPGYGAMVPMFNAAIRGMAAARHIPLLDFWVALQPLPNKGINPMDGIHPSTYENPMTNNSDSCFLTPDGLQFGYNMRNLTALQALERVRGYIQ